MNITDIYHASLRGTSQPPRLVQHTHGGDHAIDLGIGTAWLVATTAELATLIEGLSDVLSQVRIADMHAAMAPLPEVPR